MVAVRLRLIFQFTYVQYCTYTNSLNPDEAHNNLASYLYPNGYSAKSFNITFKVNDQFKDQAKKE